MEDFSRTRLVTDDLQSCVVSFIAPPSSTPFGQAAPSTASATAPPAHHLGSGVPVVSYAPLIIIDSESHFHDCLGGTREDEEERDFG
jgi:hypothetical protein